MRQHRTPPALAAAALLLAATLATGCAHSPRDRHLAARAAVHRPTPRESLAKLPTPDPRPIATVPTGE